MKCPQAFVPVVSFQLTVKCLTYMSDVVHLLVRDADEPNCNGVDVVANHREEKAMLLPPINFAMVDTGVYRSGYPSEENLPFLARLGLRSIVYLSTEKYPTANQQFVEQSSIRVFDFGIEGKDTGDVYRDIPEQTIRQALKVVLDTANHPLLIH